MIVKRSWNGKDGNLNRPSLLHAMDGLSPFTMLDLSEDEVALLNNEEDLITSASLFSVADLRQQRKHHKFCIIDEADEFNIMLKCYANLVYVVFPETCPIFKVLKELILELRDFSCEARKIVTMATNNISCGLFCLSHANLHEVKSTSCVNSPQCMATCEQRGHHTPH